MAADVTITITISTGGLQTEVASGDAAATPALGDIPPPADVDEPSDMVPSPPMSDEEAVGEGLSTLEPPGLEADEPEEPEESQD